MGIKRPIFDEDNDVEPYDHPQIMNHHEVIRFISEDHVATDQRGRRYLSRRAFDKSSRSFGKYPGMSIELKQLIEDDFLDAAIYANSKIIAPQSKYKAAIIIVVGDLRSLPEPYKVGYEPLEGPPPNDYHGEVWGRFSRGDFNIIKYKFEWLVEYPNCSLVLD